MPQQLNRRGFRLPRIRRTGERGAVVVLVAILLGFGVLLGMGALVIDVGQMYSERQQVQSGADAAAEAVAKACHGETADCASKAAYWALAKKYANLNAEDGRTDVTHICFNDSLENCRPFADNLTDCEGVGSRKTAGLEKWVEVYTATRTRDDSTLLPPTFGRAVAGNSGYNGATVGACSRAAFVEYVPPIVTPPPTTPPTGTPTTPPTPTPTVTPPMPNEQMWTKAVMISLCEWRQITANGTKIYDYDQKSTASMVSVFRQHEQLAAGSGSALCATPRTLTTPNGYDWLPVYQNDKCHNYVKAGQTVTARPVSTGESDCYGGLSASVKGKIALTFSIYDSVTGTPGNFKYHIVGVSGFVITGFRFKDKQMDSIVGPSNLCTGNEKCIYGYFTDKYLVKGSG